MRLRILNYENFSGARPRVQGRNAPLSAISTYSINAQSKNFSKKKLAKVLEYPFERHGSRGCSQQASLCLRPEQQGFSPPGRYAPERTARRLCRSMHRHARNCVLSSPCGTAMHSNLSQNYLPVRERRPLMMARGCAGLPGM